MGMSNKLPCRPGVSKLINLIPNHPQIQSQPCHWMEPNPEKKTPLHHAGKVEGLGDPLPSFQSCMPHHIVGMAREQLIEWHKTPPYSKQWKEQPLCVYLVWANDHHQVAHMPAMGKFQRVVMEQTTMVEPP